MSINTQIDLVCDPGCTLAEGPLWHADEQKLYFTDIDNCRIYTFSPTSNKCEIIWEGRYRVGGFAFSKSGSLILCAENNVMELGPCGELKTLFEVDIQPDDRFNDITTDPKGRIYAGTLKSGLFLIENGVQPRKILDNVSCSNGMTFSLNEKIFYHTNTFDYVINKYDYDSRTGAISNKKVFFSGEKSMGLPDGITLDNEGCLWVASWGTSLVRRFSPEGKVLSEINIPAEKVSSVNFGGPEMNQLFITTADKGVFRIQLNVSGRNEWLADFCQEEKK